jgi:tetratricopeptide (TPR) repeat protein
MRHRTAISLLSALLLASCGTLGSNDSKPPFYGMVYDRDNQPVQNAVVVLDGKETAATDVNGRFALANLDPGVYEVELRKEGYEPLSTSVEYFSPTQVLYVKMTSRDQLLSQAETAIAERRWQEASDLVDRADRIDPDNPATLFLRAVVLFRRGQPEEARAILEGLLARDYMEPSIHLFLADILQYRLADPVGAASHLREFLLLRYDPVVEERLKGMGN